MLYYCSLFGHESKTMRQHPCHPTGKQRCQTTTLTIVVHTGILFALQWPAIRFFKTRVGNYVPNLYNLVGSNTVCSLILFLSTSSPSPTHLVCLSATLLLAWCATSCTALSLAKQSTEETRSCWVHAREIQIGAHHTINLRLKTLLLSIYFNAIS